MLLGLVTIIPHCFLVIYSQITQITSSLNQQAASSRANNTRGREAAPTWECVDVNDGMLACLVIDDDINAK